MASGVLKGLNLNEQNLPIGTNTNNIFYKFTCDSALKSINNLNDLKNTSIRRLVRIVSISCEDELQTMKRIEREINSGVEYSPMEDVIIAGIYLGDGQFEKISKMFKGNYLVGQWLVYKGIYELNNNNNEIKARNNFLLSFLVDPSININKSIMYMYMCIWAIRDHNIELSENPCKLFDSVNRTPLSHLLLGRYFLGENELELAIQYLQATTDMNQQDGSAYYWLGKTYIAKGDISQAQDSFSKGVLEDPNYPWNYYEFAIIEINKGCYNAARKTLEIMTKFNSLEVKQTASKQLSKIEMLNDTIKLCP